MLPHVYVPIVKGKRNDLKAIQSLSRESRQKIKPLIELSEIDDSVLLDDFLDSFCTGLQKNLDVGDEYIDLYAIPPGSSTRSGENSTLSGFWKLANTGRKFTPVYGFEIDDSIWGGLGELASRLKNGFCFRVDVEDLDDQSEETWNRIITRTSEMGLSPEEIDVLLDLRFIGDADIAALREQLLDFLIMRPKAFRQRSVTLAASSALKDVGGVPLNGDASIVRREVTLWALLNAELEGSLQIRFGDYGVVHPNFIQVGANPHVQGKIRYTHKGFIHYFRGSALFKPPGFSQYKALAKRVIASGYFEGRDFSSGDAYIDGCARGIEKTGNLGTWVKVDQNHHIQHTVAQVARLSATIDRISNFKDAMAFVEQT